MPITLAQQFKDAIERPHGSASDRLLWLIELQLKRSYKSGVTIVPSLVARVCSTEQTLVWPTGGPTATYEWFPANFTFTPIEQDQEGTLPQMDLTVDNTSRVLMPYLHDGDGMEGNYCHVYLVPESAIEVPHPNHVFQKWELQVAGTFANEEGVTFRLERANFFTRMVPQDRFTARQCRWAFGSAECGYIINDVAAYSTCPKSLTACVARGQDHAARGLPVLHPGRFGGFPGIPTQR